MRVPLWGLAAVMVMTRAAVAQDQPILMLDSGGHLGLVRVVAFAPDGQHLLSAGYDKVIRVWDWRAGRTVRLLRGQVGPGDEGKIFAMAVSPDGRRLAAAGWMTVPGQPEQRIRIHDMATGDLVELLAGHTDKISALAYSPDGTRLLSASHDRTALLWDTAARRPVHRLVGHKAEVYAVGISPDGARAVTGSFDKTLRLWRVADGGLIAEMTGHKDKVYALAISPADGTIASGSVDGEIRLWDGRTGRLLRTLARQKGIVIGSLGFSPDGRWLLSSSGGPYYSGQSQRVWDVATGQAIAGYTKHDNNVFAAAVAPDGGVVATAGGDNNEIHIWDPRTGETSQVLRGSGAPVWAVGFAASGFGMAWGQTWTQDDPAAGYGPLQHQLALVGAGQMLGRPEAIAPGRSAAFQRNRVRHGPYTLAHRKGGGYGYDAILSITKAGRTAANIERGLADGYAHRSYGFSPDGGTVVSGGNNGYLAAYDLSGRPRGSFLGHEGDVWGIAASPDRRLLISGAHDQTVRLWNLDTRELIVTLFHGRDGDWVLWTPQGFYTGSPGADRIIRWQINQGPDKAAREVGADQLRKHLHRPDIVERAIILASAAAAVKEAYGAAFKLADLLDRPLPKLRILAPGGAAVLTGGATLVRVAVDSTRDPVKRFSVRVNGIQIEEQPAGSAAGELLLNVPLTQGNNRITVAAESDVGETEAAVTVTHLGEGALDQRGTLYMLAAGVDKYPNMPKICGWSGNEPCDLAYSGADAHAFEQAVRARLGPQHKEVVTTLLMDGGPNPPTAANIRRALSAVRNAATENDTVVVFISGHGVNDRADYLFMPTDATPESKGWRGDTVVPWVELERVVASTKGRRYLFVDTCHSAGAYNAKLGNAAYYADIVAYTSAGVDELALEIDPLKHGVFTYAVVDGFKGAADRNGDKLIHVEEMGMYLRDMTKALIDRHAPGYKGKRPIPELHKGRDAADHVLARL